MCKNSAAIKWLYGYQETLSGVAESRTSLWFLVNVTNMSHNNNLIINVAASQVMDAFTLGHRSHSLARV